MSMRLESGTPGGFGWSDGKRLSVSSQMLEANIGLLDPAIVSNP
jgi:hypothetical protein